MWSFLNILNTRQRRNNAWTFTWANPANVHRVLLKSARRHIITPLWAREDS